ncbi:hypothetical protein Q7P37_003122 [Cladosporium fusiforme]
MSGITDFARLAKLATHLSEDQRFTTHSYNSSQPGQRVVKYHDCWKRQPGLLGSGGFGHVYLEKCISSDDKSLGKLRAVKVLKRLKDVHYERELNAVAFFSHEKYRHCFVESFGWFDTTDEIFIAMEYLPNGDLQHHLDQTGPAPESEARTIVSQVLEALLYVHENGFTHRDLKLANIMIVDKGPMWWVKVTDFGTSKRSTENMTSMRTRSGTFQYMAPEVLEYFWEDKECDDVGTSYTNAVDVWALGVISHLLLTGRTPFQGHFSRKLQDYAAGRTTFPADILLSHNLTLEARDFTERLLAPQPLDRPSTADCKGHKWLQQPAYSTEKISEFSNSGSLYPETQASATWKSRTWQSDTTSGNRAALVDRATITRLPTFHNEFAEVDGHVVDNRTNRKMLDRETAQQPDLGEQEGLKKNQNTQTIKWGLETEHRIDPLIGLFTRPESVVDSLFFQNFVPFAISPNGTLLAAIVPKHRIKILDTTLWSLVAEFVGHDSRINTIVWSPDGMLLASGSRDCTVRLWQVAMPHEVSSRSCANAIEAIAFSPDGKVLAVGDRKGQIITVSVEKMEVLAKEEIHQTSFIARLFKTDQRLHSTCLAFSPDGQLLASGQTDGCVKLLDPMTITVLASFSSSNMVQSMAISRDGTLLATAGRNWVQIFDLTKRKLLESSELEPTNPRRLAFTGDGLLAIEDFVKVTLRDQMRVDHIVANVPCGDVYTMVSLPDSFGMGGTQ